MNTSQWLDSLVDSRTDMFSVARQVLESWKLLAKKQLSTISNIHNGAQRQSWTILQEWRISGGFYSIMPHCTAAKVL
jgi:hypothetical protein